MNGFSRIIGIFLLAASLPLQAQQPAPVESKLEQRKVVRAADGKESFAPAGAVKPGDEIEYVATYRNLSRSSVKNLEATLPIPANTEFVPGSQKPAAARASLDSRSWGDVPLKRKVQRDGREIEEQVPYREYRYLRWPAAELGGEKVLTYTARVRVLDDAAPDAAAKGGRK
jgi:uncharacterized repeat protein (TIGR01451 family)